VRKREEKRVYEKTRNQCDSAHTPKEWGVKKEKEDNFILKGVGGWEEMEANTVEN